MTKAKATAVLPNSNFVVVDSGAQGGIGRVATASRCGKLRQGSKFEQLQLGFVTKLSL